MTAETLISDTIVPLRTSDTGEEALETMNEFYIRHLPIVNNEQLLGVLSEDDILNNDVEEAVGTYSLSLTHPYVHTYDHIYEVMRMLAEHQLTVVPVVNEKHHYVGLITLEDLLKYFADTTPFREPGSIIVLEMGRHDYSLAEIARLVESEGGLIFSTLLTTIPDSTRIEVTLKINRQNIGAIIATLERFKYQIKASFNEAEYADILRDRFDSLMAYLNV